MAFEPGDVVKLKSGGIRMTVENADEHSVRCVWQEKGRTYREEFAPVLLKSSDISGPGIMVI